MAHALMKRMGYATVRTGWCSEHIRNQVRKQGIGGGGGPIQKNAPTLAGVSGSRKIPKTRRRKVVAACCGKSPHNPRTRTISTLVPVSGRPAIAPPKSVGQSKRDGVMGLSLIHRHGATKSLNPKAAGKMAHLTFCCRCAPSAGHSQRLSRL